MYMLFVNFFLVLGACNGNERELNKALADSLPTAPAMESDKMPAFSSQQIHLEGKAAVEHMGSMGKKSPFLPQKNITLPIKAADLLHIQLKASDKSIIYAIAADQQRYWQLGRWDYQALKAGHVWSGGLTLSAKNAAMKTLYLIAAKEKLAWAEELQEIQCDQLRNKIAVKSPKTVCEHVHGLKWKVPPRIRGRVRPQVEPFRSATGSRLNGLVARSNQAKDYTAIEWQFTGRP